MSEFEIIDAAAAYNSLMQSWVATYFAVMMAYLITAYIVGSKLIQSEIVIINVFFIISSALCAYAAAAAGTRALEFSIELRALNPDRESAMSQPLLWIASAIFFVGIIVALKFMWNIRHRSTN